MATRAIVSPLPSATRQAPADGFRHPAGHDGLGGGKLIQIFLRARGKYGIQTALAALSNLWGETISLRQDAVNQRNRPLA